MKSSIVLFCLVSAWLPLVSLFAQNQGIVDSLTHIYQKKTYHDTVRIQALIDLAYQYNTRPDTCLILVQKALEQSEALGFQRGIGRSLSLIGIVHFRKENYPLALQYYQKAMRIHQTIGDESAKAATYNRIGLVYIQTEDFELSKRYFEKSLSIERQLDNKYRLGIVLNNMGLAYQNLRNYPKSIEYYQEALAVRQSTEDSQGLLYSYINLGNAYLFQNEVSLALAQYTECRRLLKIQSEPMVSCNLHVGFAKAYLIQQDFDKSIREGLLGWEIAQELEQLYLKQRAAKVLYEAYKAIKDYSKALQYHEYYQEASDSLNDAQKLKAIGHIESKAALERAEQEVALLQKNQKLLQKGRRLESILTYTILFVMLGLLGFVIHLYRGWHREHQTNTLIMKQKETIEHINQNLEHLVLQRTKSLKERNQQLENYAFYNAHIMRAPVATMLGLLYLHEMEPDDARKSAVLASLHTTISELEALINQMQDSLHPLGDE